MTSHPRTRTTGDYTSTYLISYYWAGSPGVLNKNVYSWESARNFDIMRDSVNSRPRGGKYPLSALERIKAQYTGSNLVPWKGDNGLLVTPVNAPPCITYSGLMSMIPSDFSGSQFQQLNLEAFNSFSTQFPERLSFSEFALGLREIGDLLPKLEDTVAKTFAGGYLNKKFGWDNLISDLNAFSTVVQRTRDRLAWLKATYGKPTRVGYSKKDISYPGYVPGITAFFEPVRGWGTRLVLRSYRLDIGYNAYLLQRLQHLDDTIGLVRGLIGALGLNNPLKAVWVNLPYSFVVDWFLNVSSHLDAVAQIHPAEEWNVLDATRWRREHAVISVVQVNTNVRNTVPSPDTELGQIVLTRYVRAVGLPLQTGMLNLSGLDPNQLLLLTAMLVTGQK